MSKSDTVFTEFSFLKATETFPFERYFLNRLCNTTILFYLLVLFKKLFIIYIRFMYMKYSFFFFLIKFSYIFKTFVLRYL